MDGNDDLPTISHWTIWQPTSNWNVAIWKCLAFRFQDRFSHTFTWKWRFGRKKFRTWKPLVFQIPTQKNGLPQPKHMHCHFFQTIFQNCHRFVSSLIPPQKWVLPFDDPKFHLKISGTSGVIPKQPSSPAAKLVKPGLRCSHHWGWVM